MSSPLTLEATSTTADSIPNSTATETNFIDRRRSTGTATPARERRQFTNSYAELSPEAAELARSIDEYKARHRRRFIDYEEVLGVVKSLGYRRD